MRLRLFLRDAGIDPAQIALLMHRTRLQPLRDRLPWITAHRPDLLAAYNATHGPRVSATLQRHALMACFVPLDGGRHLFTGLFRNAGATLEDRARIHSDPRYAELETDFGASDTGPSNPTNATGQAFRFDFQPLDALSDYRARLVVKTPGGQGYCFKGANIDPTILALLEQPATAPPMPNWRDLTLTRADLRHLPQGWAEKLAIWRGVYLICDHSDGARYVGSAAGAENLLGRWRGHIARQHGITAQLQQRDPGNFTFSILELTAPDISPQDIIAIENGWKTRLHTRTFGLNDN